jgi:hypothetical protein
MTRRFADMSAPRPKPWTSIDTIIALVATFIVLVALIFGLVLAIHSSARDSWISRQGLHNTAGQ